jgi:hypothetical protein
LGAREKGEEGDGNKVLGRTRESGRKPTMMKNFFLYNPLTSPYGAIFQ